MNDYGHCPDCGGSDGIHFDGCAYEGVDNGHSSYSRGHGTKVSAGKWWIGYIIALIIGYGFNELLGAMILLGLIFWSWVSE